MASGQPPDRWWWYEEEMDRIASATATVLEVKFEFQFKELSDKVDQLSDKLNKELERYANAEAELNKLERQQAFTHQSLASEFEKLRWRYEEAMRKLPQAAQQPPPAQPLGSAAAVQSHPAKPAFVSSSSTAPAAMKLIMQADHGKAQPRPPNDAPPAPSPPQPAPGPAPPPTPEPTPAQAPWSRLPLVDVGGYTRILADGLIVDNWMPGHPHFRQGPWTPKPGRPPCTHFRTEWFVKYFDQHSHDYFDFASSSNVHAWSVSWSNKLYTMCCSARDVFQIPSCGTHGTTLYKLLLDRPELHLQWHKGNGGSFYLAIGCAICSSVTDHYQPQYQVHDLGLNPHGLPSKDLKSIPEVQQAFRSFLAEILGDTSLLAV